MCGEAIPVVPTHAKGQGSRCTTLLELSWLDVLFDGNSCLMGCTGSQVGWQGTNTIILWHTTGLCSSVF